MIGINHVIFGVAAWAGASEIIVGPPSPISMAVVALAAVLPDIDHPGSWVGRRVPVLPWILAIFPHRSLGHAGVIGVAMLVVAAIGGVGLAFAWGWCSHLLGDFCTPSGIPVWPGGKSYSARIFQTGSALEYIIVWGFSFIIIIGIRLFHFV